MSVNDLIGNYRSVCQRLSTSIDKEDENGVREYDGLVNAYYKALLTVEPRSQKEALELTRFFLDQLSPPEGGATIKQSARDKILAMVGEGIESAEQSVAEFSNGLISDTPN